MKVKKIRTNQVTAAEVPQLLDQEHTVFQPICTVNWPEYPYRPEVSFRMAYTDTAILLHYRVKEASVRARYGNDNEAVWTDSCVEFFSIPAGDGIYYNIECNCIGTVLVGVGATRHNREHAPLEVASQIERWSSLGRTPFEERKEETAWEVVLVIPFKAFFKHQIQTLEGQKVKANFYKCGDELQTPHFLSWNPIRTEQPDFHRPDFFGEVDFE